MPVPDTPSAFEPILSPDRIAALATFATSHTDGWSRPSKTAMVVKTRVIFYAGTKYVGEFGVGPGFITSKGCGGFQFLDISATDANQLKALLAVR